MFAVSVSLCMISSVYFGAKYLLQNIYIEAIAFIIACYGCRVKVNVQVLYIESATLEIAGDLCTGRI